MRRHDSCDKRRLCVWPIAASVITIPLCLTAIARDARACECAPPSMLLPTSADKNVPNNAKVWIWSTRCSDASLRVKDGSPIETTSTIIAVGHSEDLIVLHPVAPLEIGTTYELTACSTMTPKPEFTVATGPDSSRPSVPSFWLDSVTETPDEGCGTATFAKVHVTSDGDLLVLDIARRAKLDDAAFSGKVVDITQAGWPWAIGEMACSGNWDFGADGDANGVRIAAFDIAGNFSGWSASQSISAPDDGCGCSAVGSSTSRHAPWLLLVMMAWLGQRARYRSKQSEH